MRDRITYRSSAKNHQPLRETLLEYSNLSLQNHRNFQSRLNALCNAPSFNNMLSMFRSYWENIDAIKFGYSKRAVFPAVSVTQPAKEVSWKSVTDLKEEGSSGNIKNLARRLIMYAIRGAQQNSEGKVHVPDYKNENLTIWQDAAIQDGFCSDNMLYFRLRQADRILKIPNLARGLKDAWDEQHEFALAFKNRQNDTPRKNIMINLYNNLQQEVSPLTLDLPDSHVAEFQVAELQRRIQKWIGPQGLLENLKGNISGLQRDVTYDNRSNEIKNTVEELLKDMNEDLNYISNNNMFTFHEEDRWKQKAREAGDEKDKQKQHNKYGTLLYECARISPLVNITNLTYIFLSLVSQDLVDTLKMNLGKLQKEVVETTTLPAAEEEEEDVVYVTLYDIYSSVDSRAFMNEFLPMLLKETKPSDALLYVLHTVGTYMKNHEDQIVSQMNGYFKSMPTKKTAILPPLTEFKKQVEAKAKVKAKAKAAPSSSSDPPPPLEEEFYPPVGRKKAIQKYVKSNGLHGFGSQLGTMILENIDDLKSWKTILRTRDEDTMNSVVNVLKEEHPDWFYTASHNVTNIEKYLQNAFKVKVSSTSDDTDTDAASTVTLKKIPSRKKGKSKGRNKANENEKASENEDDYLIQQAIEANRGLEEALAKETNAFVKRIMDINNAMKNQDIPNLTDLMSGGFEGREVKSFVKSKEKEKYSKFPLEQIRSFANELVPNARHPFVHLLLAFTWGDDHFSMFDLNNMTYPVFECFMYEKIISPEGEMKPLHEVLIRNTEYRMDYPHLIHMLFNGANYYNIEDDTQTITRVPLTSSMMKMLLYQDESLRENAMFHMINNIPKNEKMKTYVNIVKEIFEECRDKHKGEGIFRTVVDSLDMKNPLGTTPLVYAIRTKGYDVVKLLLDLGADVNKTSIREGQADPNYTITPLGAALHKMRMLAENPPRSLDPTFVAELNSSITVFVLIVKLEATKVTNTFDSLDLITRPPLHIACAMKLKTLENAEYNSISKPAIVLNLVNKMQELDMYPNDAIDKRDGTCLTPLFNSIEDTMESIEETIETFEFIIDRCKGPIESFINHVTSRPSWCDHDYIPLFYLIDKYNVLNVSGIEKEYTKKFMELFDKVLNVANIDMKITQPKGSRNPLLHYILRVTANDKRNVHLPLIKLLRHNVDKNVNLDVKEDPLKILLPIPEAETKQKFLSMLPSMTPLQSALTRIIFQGPKTSILNIPRSLMEEEPRPCVTMLDGVLLIKFAMESKDEKAINSILPTVLKHKTWTLPEYKTSHQRLDEGKILEFLKNFEQQFSEEKYEQLESYFKA